MKKEVNAGDKKVVLVFNAATPLIVKQMFNLDPFRFFKESEDMDVFERIPYLEKLAYTMAMQAEFPTKDVMEKEDGFIDWVAQFEFTELTSDILPVATEMWVMGNSTTSTPKNPDGPQ